MVADREHQVPWRPRFVINPSPALGLCTAHPGSAGVPPPPLACQKRARRPRSGASIHLKMIVTDRTSVHDVPSPPCPHLCPRGLPRPARVTQEASGHLRYREARLRSR